jgi:uncharacterized membrane protein YqaE (UPF0057 family)
MQKTKVLVCALAMALGVSTTSNAAFYVPAKATQTEVVATATQSNAVMAEATQTASIEQAASMVSKKAGDSGISKTLYIVLAILGWGFIGVGMNTDWQGSTWIIALVLSILFWIPGVIYSLIKMKEYYK